jgi:hypothetical protein
MEWRELFPERTREEILEQIEKLWDLDLPLPVPKFTPLCVCGATTWHARLWLFWDRTGGGVLDHRITHRCDTSLKCQECGQVIIWGVPIPQEWIDFWQWRLDVQIDFRTAQRVFDTFEERLADGLDPTEWRHAKVAE